MAKEATFDFSKVMCSTMCSSMVYNSKLMSDRKVGLRLNSPTQVKKGSMIGTWTRLENSTIQDHDLIAAVCLKAKELRILQYPLRNILGTLHAMYRKGQNDKWLSAAHMVKSTRM